MPPGSCSMLMTRALVLVAATIFGGTEHHRVGRDLAGQDHGVVVHRDPDVLAGKSMLQRLLQRRHAGIDDDVVLLAPADAPHDQAHRPGAAAVDQHLARLDDDGVRDLRIGDRDAGDVVGRGQHHRPARGEHQHAIAIEAAGIAPPEPAPAPGRSPLRLARRLAGASERPAPGSARPAGATSTARTHSLLGSLLARRHVARLLFFFVLHGLGRPLGAADRLDRVRRRRRRRRRHSGRGGDGRPWRRTWRGRRRSRIAHQAAGADAGALGRHVVQRIAQRQRDAPFGGGERDPLGVLRA